jgi:hypothetical protein
MVDKIKPIFYFMNEVGEVEIPSTQQEALQVKQDMICKGFILYSTTDLDRLFNISQNLTKNCRDRLNKWFVEVCGGLWI